ncbi:mannosyl-glycoendo-beta-N-acetylglucosaminidase family protein [Listeria floridensis FSL S10-1187]|uniref:Mannosyl-glycoendo-beta-N-acetylglucosaminidase family protein n=1 Tax=Listeria floridensis FSL S10-1187 TaxID=1265817 RepID=A0ABP3B0N9_9LIST|nr:glucosaminidase domain-containing protein [Listeria floridensis]EUJ33486.1 mannosyl-glycoendo-beta-N-acetylglucosaminidase family protein [Listeria floridensis FSL S10-1187]
MQKNFIVVLAACLMLFLSQFYPEQKVEANASLDQTYLVQKREIGEGFYSEFEPRMGRSVKTDNFLESIKAGALSGWKKYRILPSITSAQAILESGWGSSELSVRAHNLFGIKGSFQGQFIIMPTKEYQNGKWVTIDAQFRQYPNKNASIENHGEFLQKSRYQNLVGLEDYKLAAKRLQQDGYATDPAYSEKLISLVEQYRLTDWDREAGANLPSTNVAARVVNGAPLLSHTQFKEKHPLRLWKTGTKIQVRKFNTYWYKTSVQVDGQWKTGYIYHSMVKNLTPIQGTDKYSGTVQAFAIWWDNSKLSSGELFTQAPGTAVKHYPSNNNLKSAYYPKRTKVFFTPNYWLN